MLANETGKDLYVTLPPTATANYITGLANLLKNGDSVGGNNYPGLLPNLNVYIEWSDEDWGGLPWSSTDAVQGMQIAQAADNQDWHDYVAMGGARATFTVASNSGWCCARWTSATSSGASTATPPCLPRRTACPTPIRASGPCTSGSRAPPILTAGAKRVPTRCRPWTTTLACRPTTISTAEGAAWYADDMDNATTVDQLFADAPTILNTLAGTKTSYGAIGGGNAGGINLTAQVENDVAICQAFGLHEVGYEGGFDFGGGSATSIDDSASLDPRIEGLVQTTLNQYFQGGGALPVVNCATDLYGNQGWGVQNSMWDESRHLVGRRRLPQCRPAQAPGLRQRHPGPAAAHRPPRRLDRHGGRRLRRLRQQRQLRWHGQLQQCRGRFTLEDYNPGFTGIGGDGWLNYNSDQYYTVTTPVSGNTMITAEVTAGYLRQSGPRDADFGQRLRRAFRGHLLGRRQRLHGLSDQRGGRRDNRSRFGFRAPWACGIDWRRRLPAPTTCSPATIPPTTLPGSRWAARASPTPASRRLRSLRGWPSNPTEVTPPPPGRTRWRG